MLVLHLKVKLNESIEESISKDVTINRYKDHVDNLKYLRYLETLSDGRSLDRSLIFQDGEGDEMPIYEIFKEKTLVFRITESSCTPCLKKKFGILNKMLKDKQPLNCIVLATFLTYKDAKEFCNSVNINWPIYNCNRDFDLPIEKNDISYFFMLYENLICHNFQSVLTNEYREIFLGYFDAINR
ncbi:MAG: hypothetical protein JW924_00015 [Fusobacteriaceae bacterium]|nr:hypothetical protein [Fusobacteriaceae bacterium]